MGYSPREHVEDCKAGLDTFSLTVSVRGACSGVTVGGSDSGVGIEGVLGRLPVPVVDVVGVAVPRGARGNEEMVEVGETTTSSVGKVARKKK
jgi:hypothetical protein